MKLLQQFKFVLKEFIITLSSETIATVFTLFVIADTAVVCKWFSLLEFKLGYRRSWMFVFSQIVNTESQCLVQLWWVHSLLVVMMEGWHDQAMTLWVHSLLVVMMEGWHDQAVTLWVHSLLVVMMEDQAVTWVHSLLVVMMEDQAVTLWVHSLLVVMMEDQAVTWVHSLLVVMMEGWHDQAVTCWL